MPRPSDTYLSTVSPEDFSEADYLRCVADDYGFTPAQLLQVLSTAEGRVRACKSRMLLWVLIYSRASVTLKSGPHADEVTMNTLSLDVFSSANEWATPNDEPGQRRICEVAPRESGKSILLAVLFPSWLLCTSYQREFVCVFTSSHPKSKERMSSIRKLLLRASADYEGVRAARRGSFSESDTMQRLKLANGSVLFSSGITSSAISGLLDEDLRPSLTILDDISPSGGEWSLHEDDKRLRTVREVVFDLGKLARSLWVGTTTAYGSLVHQALEAKAATNAEHWSAKDKWDIRHHRPLINTPQSDGSIKELSYWPKLYTVEFLISERSRDDRLWGINWENSPLSAGDGTWWTRELFRYEELPSVSLRVLSVDPGVSKTGDPCGITVASFSHSAKMACIDEALELAAKSTDVQRVILHLLAKYPDISVIVWEQTQGGSEYFYSIMGQNFEKDYGVRAYFEAPQGDKAYRAEILLGRYKNNQVVHGEALRDGPYEKELLSMPFYLRSPNMTDSAGAAIRYISKAGTSRNLSVKTRRT